MAKNKKSAPNQGERKNTGHRGSRKNPQDTLTQIIRGEGRVFKHFPQFRGQPYAGVPGVFGSFNMKQAKLNREAGLC